MNYKKQYEALIQSRREKGIPQGYVEKHHIIPRSFGGGNDSDNLIAMTAREHFIAHRFLAKIYPNSGMTHAVWRMTCSNLTMKRFKVTSRVYEQLRKDHAYRVSTNEESKIKKSLATKGKKQSAEHVEARTKSRLENGPWLSEETKKKIGDGNRGKIGTWSGKKMPAEYVEKRNQTRKDNGNYTWSEERKIKFSESRKGKKSNRRELTENEKLSLAKEKSQKVTCPHCGKEGAMLVMPRWHFDNCKKKSA
jgi:DNA-directed RNA polymerase subunit M/transcription elongation factor TFIIS